jgi:16S rRNA G966 N2-methylase RsmD
MNSSKKAESSPSQDRFESDRDRLRRRLLGKLSNRIITLEQIHEAGKVFFNTENHLSFYGMPPDVYYGKGIRILDRTAIEGTVDSHARYIAVAVKKAVAEHYPRESFCVLDLFMGSGNLLYHMSKSVNSALSIGIEANRSLCALVRNNYRLLGFDATTYDGDFTKVLGSGRVPAGMKYIVLVDPPWGHAFSFEKGLDLSSLKTPLPGIFSKTKEALQSATILFVLHTHELMYKHSLKMLDDGALIIAAGKTRGSPRGTNTGFVLLRAE